MPYLKRTCKLHVYRTEFSAPNFVGSVQGKMLGGEDLAKHSKHLLGSYIAHIYSRCNPLRDFDVIFVLVLG